MAESNYNRIDTKTLGALCRELVRSNTKPPVTKKKVYFAGPWFSDKAQLLHSTYKKLYNMYKNESRYEVYFPNDFHSEDTFATFNKDVEKVVECDILVAMVDEKDMGTAWEIGMAYALDKQVYLIGFDETTFKKKTNLMLAYTGRCFTLENWCKFLVTDLDSVDYIDIEKTWEGLE